MTNEITDNTMSNWMTAREAACYLRVKKRTLLLWTRQGRVRGYSLSGTHRHVWRFRKIDLDAALSKPRVLNSSAPVVLFAERRND